MIDLHSHILPGLDDGARTLDESVDMARAAVADGIEVIAATPHVRGDYPTQPEMMERALADLRAALDAESVALDVRPGGEIALDRLGELSADDLRRFGLGGSPKYLLVEFPYSSWPFGLENRIHELQLAGFTPVLAHPERNGEVQARPGRLEPLVDGGALVQVTAASLDGRLGSSARACATELVERELVHLLASDAHAPSIRAVGMSGAVRAIGDATLAAWLVRDAPAAILAGEPLPERPAVASSSGWRGLLRRARR